MKTAAAHKLFEKEPVHLPGIAETLVIPLWARAIETKRKCPIIRDEKALEIVETLDYDFSKFDGAWMTQTGIAIRTQLIDEAAKRFIAANPGTVVVNLGCGLSTRYPRMHERNVRCWYEIDLPEVIALRHRFFRQSRSHRFIAGSVTDPATLDKAAALGNPVLLIAEGLFMYFEEPAVRSVFADLARRFPGAGMILEMLAPSALGMGRYDPCLSKMRSGRLEFRWTLRTPREMESWGLGIRIHDEQNVLDVHKERWGWLNFFAPHAFSMLGNRIVQLRFD